MVVYTRWHVFCYHCVRRFFSHIYERNNLIPMSLVKRKSSNCGPQPEYADTVTSTKLFKSDQPKFNNLCATLKRSPAEVLRQLVSEALTRRELLSREGSGAEGVSPHLIRSLLANELKPLREEQENLKGCMRELASMVGDLSPVPTATAANRETHEMVEQVLVQINQALNTILEEIWAIRQCEMKLLGELNGRQKRAESWTQAAYALSGNSYTYAWTILDLLTRYVVVPQIAAIEPGKDAVLEAEDELRAGRAKARHKRRRLERRLNLPRDGKVKFLGEPQDKPEAVRRRRPRRAKSQGEEEDSSAE